ncbi:MAG TPA: GNAT family N-acetyltransferase [Leucothrix sp.]|nr:GNAT family N-acetyltransferase [Leucothrix sp.]HIQ16261.1 GNAT family N-acetyltransferase [Leucothrix sp.]
MMKIIQADLSNSTHANALVTLLNLYAQDSMGGGEELPNFTKDNLAKEIHKRPAITVILAFDDDKPAGLINCIEGFSTFACKPLINIHDVFVDANYRGKGIATMLLQAAEELAIEKQCCKITLEVLEGNRAAKLAYQKFGFDSYELDPEMGKAMFWQKEL